ncbi:hypothetical protein FKM82_003424 [Ascaphus truei]
MGYLYLVTCATRCTAPRLKSPAPSEHVTYQPHSHTSVFPPAAGSRNLVFSARCSRAETVQRSDSSPSDSSSSRWRKGGGEKEMAGYAACGRAARSLLTGYGSGTRASAAVALFRPGVRCLSSCNSSLQPSRVPKTSISEPPWTETKLPDIAEEEKHHTASVDAECGDRIRLEKVLLVGSDNFTLIGKPLLGRDLVRVEATVIEKTDSRPIISMRFWRRHRFQRKKITVKPQTVLRINTVEISPALS